MSFCHQTFIKSAYRSHRCDYCSEIILKRSSYKKSVGISYEGDFFCNRVHLECENPFHKYLQGNDDYAPDTKMTRGGEK